MKNRRALGAIITPLGVLLKYRFAVGAYVRTVTVKAYCYEEAVELARDMLDHRAYAKDQEPPVGWTLTLLSALPVHTGWAPTLPKGFYTCNS